MVLCLGERYCDITYPGKLVWERLWYCGSDCGIVSQGSILGYGLLGNSIVIFCLRKRHCAVVPQGKMV